MEEAVSVKGLRLMAMAISLVAVLILGTLAYSGFQEFNYVTQDLGQQGLGGSMVFNATHISIADLDLENRGLYPIALALDADLTVEGFSIGSSSLGPLTIPPGSRSRIDFNLPVQFSQAFSDPVVLSKILFNGTSMDLRIDVAGGMHPFLNAKVSGTLNNTVGPVLDGFNLRIQSPTLHNETHVKVPLTIGFTNNSPIPLDATFSARIISTPTMVAVGSYGFGSTRILADPGQSYQETVDIFLRTDAVAQGVYVAELELSGQGFTYSWRQDFRGE
ncbi:MAG: hypothetical protein HY619_00590 [Thaumarchaeota archaeon]|nr:hypothetical protein [Nitrososphaerota archaeon]